VNWDAIGAVGEILGASAVIVTLAYLAVQVSFAKKVAAETNRLNRSAGVGEALLATALNDDMRDSLMRTNGLESWYQEYADELGVSFDDAARADSMNVYWFWLHWGQWSATNDDQGLAELTNLIRTMYSKQPILYSWIHSPMSGRTILEPQFVKFVDDVLASSPSN
jgi:hypothetical protein